VSAHLHEEPAGPEAVCRDFVDAVLWGEHHRVWDMLGEDGRKTVVRVAVSRGMDEGLAMRLRTRTATPTEMDQFLTDLVQGLRADLDGNDLERLEYTIDRAASTPDRVRVTMSVPVPEPLAHTGALPVGSFELTPEGGDEPARGSGSRGSGSRGWRVERLIPRPGS